MKHYTSPPSPSVSPLLTTSDTRMPWVGLLAAQGTEFVCDPCMTVGQGWGHSTHRIPGKIAVSSISLAQVFMTAAFRIANKLSQPRCPLTNEQIDNMGTYQIVG